MGKFCKIVLSLVIVITLFLVNLCPAEAAEISAHTTVPKSVSENETLSEIVWKEASTIDELMALLGKGNMLNSGGNIRITGDLIIPAGKAHPLYPETPKETPLVIDLGSHTLYVEGTLIVNGHMTFTGLGGENGLIHVNKGGFARFHSSVVFTAAAQDGYSIWQEIGAALRYEPNSSSLGNVHFAQPPEAEASTFEELYSLFSDMNDTGGVIRVTDNLVVPAGEEGYSIWPARSEDTILVDMGEHTLYVEGSLRVQSGVEFSGEGGKNGLIHVRQGGKACIFGAVLKADAGYAVIQEEGAVFAHTATADDKGEVQYAKNPAAEPASSISWQTSMPVAVVNDDQAVEDVLPKTDLVTLYLNGLEDNGPLNEGVEIPVTWNLEPYRKQLKVQERVLITGSYPGAAAVCEPVCLVVFQNGNPVVFLDCWGTENYGRPGAKVKVKLFEPELGCRFEWSQDGKAWFPADAKKSMASSDERLAYQVTFPQEEAPSYPYCLSAVVDYPDGTQGYSDVLVIQEARTLCDSGGNRGGGTDLSSPELPPGNEDDTMEDDKTEDNITEDDTTEDKDVDTLPDKPQNPDSETGTSSTKPKSPNSSTDCSTDTLPAQPEIPDNNSNDDIDASQSRQKPDESNSIQEVVVPMPAKASSSSDIPKIEKKEISNTVEEHEEWDSVVSKAAIAKQKAVQSGENRLPAQKKPLLQTKGIAQMTAGIAVTGGIVVLTIAWNPRARWIKRLRRGISALLNPHKSSKGGR